MRFGRLKYTCILHVPYMYLTCTSVGRRRCNSQDFHPWLPHLNTRIFAWKAERIPFPWQFVPNFVQVKNNSSHFYNNLNTSPPETHPTYSFHLETNLNNQTPPTHLPVPNRQSKNDSNRRFQGKAPTITDHYSPFSRSNTKVLTRLLLPCSPQSTT